MVGESARRAQRKTNESLEKENRRGCATTTMITRVVFAWAEMLKGRSIAESMPGGRGEKECREPRGRVQLRDLKKT